MKLKALKYCNEEGVSVKPGEVFEVSRDIGRALTERHPDWFELAEEPEKKEEKKPEDNKSFQPKATKGKRGK